MPLTSLPINPKNKKIKKNSPTEKVFSFLSSEEHEKNEVLPKSQNVFAKESVEPKPLNMENNPASSENTASNNDSASNNNSAVDSRKEFFRLMAEKIKDKDFNINKAMAMKEEINKLEKKEPVGYDDSEDEDSDDADDNSEFIEQEYEQEEFDEENNSQSVSKNIPEKTKSINLYKKMVYRFLFLTVVLLLFVSYFSFVKLDITVHPERNDISGSLNFYAYSNGEQINLDRAIKSSINKIEIEEKGVFESSGEKNSGGEIVGRVKIINNYSKNQPLVATTRLLSSGDKLFRIKDTVNVPAGGSVEVDVYADTVAEDMAIDPDKFIIPGLWSGVQDKIYAESYQKFEFVKDSKKYIMEKDIKDATESLNKKILEQSRIKAQSAIGSGKQYVLSIDQNSAVVNQSKKIGEETPSFEISVKNIVNLISFETEDIVRLAKQKLSMETGQDVSEIDADSFVYELVNFNSAKNLAEIKVSFSARTLLGSKDFINKKHLSNLNRKQIEAYLDNIKEIKSYELKFTPGFVERSPLLLDKIKIEYR